jgi:hypothetical protein
VYQQVRRTSTGAVHESASANHAGSDLQLWRLSGCPQQPKERTNGKDDPTSDHG